MAPQLSFVLANNAINGYQTATARQDDHRAAEESRYRYTAPRIGLYLIGYSMCRVVRISLPMPVAGLGYRRVS
jgi:hypothetical protein